MDRNTLEENHKSTVATGCEKSSSLSKNIHASLQMSENVPQNLKLQSLKFKNIEKLYISR